MTADRGFSLVEALIAAALMMVVTAAAVVLATAHVPAMVAVPEALDLSQRARAGLQVLSRALEMAGAGVTTGPRTGALVHYFAPILPRLPHVDAPSVARADAFTVLAVPYTRAQGVLALPLPSGASTAVLATLAHCAIGLPSCGFLSDTSAVVFDDLGNMDVAAVVDVEATHLGLRARPGGAGPAFMPGASFVEATVHAYYWDADAQQLRHHDLDRTDMPVLDRVTHFAVEYFGDVSPPRDPRPPIGEANCLYNAAGVTHPGLMLLAPPPFTLFRLPLDRFTDGPWCGVGAMQYDADLLRVRTVRVSMRLRPGPAGAGGRIPDFVMTFDVAPRNLAVLQ